jgi:plasmid stabilization system protein ParE
MKKHYQVVIPSTAKESLHDIISHIKKESPVAAVKVRKELIRLTKSLSESPERFSKEEYLLDKPGNYRSVACWHYKIIYKVLTKEVVILRFIHTSRNPELIRKIE